MHFLTRQRLHLSLFHPLMKVLLSLYILSVAAGIWVATLKYSDRATWSQPGLADYVSGAAEPEHGDPFGDDPFAGLDGDDPVGLSRRQLVDIVHPHLFSIPLVLFVLGHLLHLTRLPDALKLTINVAAFGSFAATFGLPFLMLDDRALAPLLLASGWTMLISFALLCVIPLWETWFGRPGAKPFDAIPRRARQD